jgi:hypothetical protein
MASILSSDIHALFERRILAMRPDSPRHWGRMSPHEAICHLADGFRMALGEKPVAPISVRFKPMVRFVALRVPMRWPRGIKTMPEVEQGRGGTPPAEFERDRQELLALMARFRDATATELAPTHPLFGPMRPGDWGTWARRHLDHHLRQFRA